MINMKYSIYKVNCNNYSDVTDSKIYHYLSVVASKLEDLFSYEIRHSIAIDRLMQTINREGNDVEIRIISLIKRDEASKMFALSSDRKRILYTPQRADEKRLYKHEAELILEFRKDGQRTIRKYQLKGKYLNMHIDYKSSTAYIGNDIRTLKYVVANQELMNVRLLDDINSYNEKLKLCERKLNIDLNKHKLQVDSITIVDSEVRISNGVLNCSSKLCKWRLKNNVYNFIWIYKSKKYTSLELDAVFIREEIVDFFSCKEEEKAACLIGCASVKGKKQVDKIALKNCIFKLKDMNRNCETYILNSNATENLIMKNDFYDSNRVLKFQGGQLSVQVLLLRNSFNNQSTMERNILTVIPSKDRGKIIINEVEIKSTMNMELLRLKAVEVGEALLSLKKGSWGNNFKAGCTIDIFGDERGTLHKCLKFEEDKWCEKLPPRLLPDRVNNDMQHYISISFRPQKVWSDNITKIIVLNSRGRVLNKDQYHVDGIRGIITIYNVSYDKTGKPSFEGLLEPGLNYIMVKAKDFEDNWLCQVIRPIQVIEVKNGIGKVVTKILDKGLYKLKAAVISNGKKIEIESPVNIKIR